MIFLFSYNFKNGPNRCKSIVFISGTSNFQKKWPLENWIKLAHLFDQYNYKFIFHGEMLKNMKNAWRFMTRQQIVKF